MSKKSTNAGVGKKVLASALSAAMVVAFTPAVSFATGNDDAVAYADEASADATSKVVASYNGTEYGNIDEAMSVWKTSGGVLKLLDDCTCNSTSPCALTADCRLDLNGKVLKLASRIQVNPNHTLTIDDCSSEKNGLIQGKFNNNVIQGQFSSHIVINAGMIESLDSGTAVRGGANDVATVQVNGGVLKSGNYALDMNGANTSISGGIVGKIHAVTATSSPRTLVLGNDPLKPVIVTDSVEIADNETTVEFNNCIVKSVVGDFNASNLKFGDNSYFEEQIFPGSLKMVGVSYKGKPYFQVTEASQEDMRATVTGVAGSSSVSYLDPRAAASVLKDGETLTLLKDYDGRLEVNACATIDLGGNTIRNNTSEPAINVLVDGNNRTEAGTVVVKNGSIHSGGDVINADGTGVALNVELDGSGNDQAITMSHGDGYLSVRLKDSARIRCGGENSMKDIVGNGFYVPIEAEDGYVYGIEGGLTYAAKFAQAGSVIKLLDNYDGPVRLSYNEGGNKAVALDLDGKCYHYTGAEDDRAALELDNSSSNLTVKNGSIQSDSGYVAYAFSGTSNNANDKLRLAFDGVSLVTSKGEGVGINGNLAAADLELKDTTIVSGNDKIGIYFPVNGVLSVVDSTVEGGAVGVAAKRGTVNISGKSTIKATTSTVVEPSDYYTGGQGGFTASGYALYAEGGYGDVSVNVNGGSFESAGDAVKTFVKTEDADKVKVAVVGGTFSSDVSSFVDKSVSVEYAMHGGKTFVVQGKDAVAPANTSGYYWGAADDKGVRTEVTIPYTPVTPTPRPEPMPAAPGTNVSGADSAGNTVEATVTDNNKATLPDGTVAAGSVEFKGVTSASGSGSAEPAKSVDVPATVTAGGSTYVVTKIADEAFAGQSQLESVSIPETVVEIGSKAFAGTSISKVVIPAATKTIGVGVFQGCASLESVDIKSAALNSIPADAFNGTALASIDIPASVTSIGARAFKGTKLESVELPKAVTTIEKGTFQNCSELKGVASSAKVVAKSAFAGCSSLKTVSLPKATEVGASAFNGTALKSVSLPKAEAIGASAFKNAAKLKTLATGAKLEAIGPKALSGAKNLKVLTVTSKKLTKKGVHDSLKGSSVKRVEVAVSGGKSALAKYVAKYGKFFKKSNSGKSVSVVPAKGKRK